MSYCQTHGRFDDYFDRGCPACRDAEEREELDREEMRSSLSEIANTRANTRTNLGDYDCPYCMQTSLKAGASRCPLCRGEIGRDYWSAVRAREKADAERQAAAFKAAAERKRALEEAAAAELIRTAPERESAARAAALAAANAAAEARRQRRNAASLLNAAKGAGCGATLGGIALGIAGCVSCSRDIGSMDFNLFNGLLYGAIGGAVIGLLWGIAIGQMKD